MFIRRRPLLRTAVVGGVAYAAGSHVATKSAEQSQMEAQQNAQIADLQQQAAAAPPVYQQPVASPAAAAPEPSSNMGPDTLEQLKRLGELRDSKVLTEAEFEAAKRKILGNL